MRILLLAAASSVHTVRWANAYVARGHQVDLVTQHAPLAGLDGAVRVHRLPHWGGLGYLLNGPRLVRLLRRISPEVVNAHYATGYGTLARWCRKVPVVLNVWGSDVFAFPARGALFRRWVRRNLEHATHIVSTSVAMAERTRTLMSRPVPITVVPFGVDTGIFVPRTESPKDGSVTIGTVKALSPVYGVDLLVEAFIALAEKHKEHDLRLRIVGGGAQRKTLERRVQAAGLAHRVAFIGPVPHYQVPGELAQLDIYVALSREESFGVAVVEATACGLPVLVSRVGGLPEVVEEGVTGTVVPAGDVPAAVAALEHLVNDPALRRTMGEAGRQRVERLFAWNNCVDRMVEVLEAVRKEQQP